MRFPAHVPTTEAEAIMKLSAPTMITFLVSLALVVLGVVGKVTPSGILSVYTYAFVFIGYVVLAVGCLFKGV